MSSFLDLPAEIRINIYQQIFANAKLTLHDSHCSLTTGFGRKRSNIFQRRNIHTNILLTCRTCFDEGQKVFYDNLVLSQEHGQYSSIWSFVSCMTRANVKVIQNVMLDQLRVEQFPSLRTLLYSQTLYVAVDEESGSEDSECEPKDLFSGTVRGDGILYDVYAARKYCRYRVAEAIEARQIDMLAEVCLIACNADSHHASAYGYRSSTFNIITHLSSCPAEHVEMVRSTISWRQYPVKAGQLTVYLRDTSILTSTNLEVFWTSTGSRDEI